jgi:pimeloyl-ACP methyl ester carboxylesterase
LDAYTLSIPSPIGTEEIAILPRSTGEHPFVAWHGVTAVNRFWFWNVLWPLGAVSLVGLPGHGPLKAQPNSHFDNWTPEHFIEVSKTALRTLTNGRPATLIGHSTGGMIALGIAQTAPELVQRLILIAPVVWSELTGIVGFWQRFANYPRLLRLVVRLSLEPGRLNRRVFTSSMTAFIRDREGFYGNERVALAIEEGYADMRKTQLAAIAGTTRVLTKTDMRPLVQQNPTTIPTLLIHGTKDPIVPYEQSEWLHQHLPNATMASIQGAGHLPYGEQEENVNQLVLDWLAQHPV